MEKDSIVPAVSISNYQLNWRLDELMAHLSSNFTVEDHEHCSIIHHGNYSFWINANTGRITQIGVNGNFSGSFNGIGIGSTLSDVKKKYGKWEDGLDVYLIPNIDGICFELADNDRDEEWIRERAPIEAIYVYEPKEFDAKGENVFNAETGQYLDNHKTNPT